MAKILSTWFANDPLFIPGIACKSSGKEIEEKGKLCQEQTKKEYKKVHFRKVQDLIRKKKGIGTIAQTF